MSEVLAVFVESSLEHLQRMESAILDIEEGKELGPLLDEIYRAAHTLKGDARVVGLSDVENLVHSLEDRLEELRGGKSPVPVADVNDLLARRDQIQSCIETCSTGGAGCSIA